jgi:hypothetical protein
LPRHASPVDERRRVIRLSCVAFVWLCGLGAGLCAVLAAAAKYGCMGGDQALACKTSGSVLGVVLLITVIATVTVVALTTVNRPTRAVIVISAVGVVALAICTFAAASLLSTA